MTGREPSRRRDGGVIKDVNNAPNFLEYGPSPRDGTAFLGCIAGTQWAIRASGL